MKIPTREQAHALLVEAEKGLPGRWGDHCRIAAQCAEAIAKRHPNMDAECAYVLALLHDIGRIKGVYALRHAVDGYEYMMDKGYADAARICLTHSFPVKKVESYSGVLDVTDEQLAWIQAQLDILEYTDYDRLCQLCDALVLPSGPCVIEQRLMDVAFRHGINDYSVDKWKAFLQMKKDFEEVIGCNIYQLLQVKAW